MWSKREEGNSLEGFKKAFEHGYGIETDIRDYDGRLVVSHNIATGQAFEFEDVLKLYTELNCDTELAINIKADGLQAALMNLIKKYNIKKYFVFDMSVPEQVVFHRDGFNAFTRMSEYETVPVLLQKAQGIWMDEWENSWINADVIKKYRDENKIISIISPEIHGRDKTFLWNELKCFSEDDGVLLCTDIPLEAEGFFNE
jgi:hypothetical protein